MSDDDEINKHNKSLINVEASNLLGINDPGKELIKQICGGLGGLYKPLQTILNAKANAKANEIKAESDGRVAKIKNETQLQIEELKERAAERIIKEYIEDQENIESIAIKAAEKVKEDANINDMSPDFKRSFTENARFISDDKMQEIWADILAGEANSPGSFSKKTLSILQTLEKSDAETFQKLCNFNCSINDSMIPVVYDFDDSIYIDNGINFSDLAHLSTLGLIQFKSKTLGRIVNETFFFLACYDNFISFKRSRNKSINIGYCNYTQSGQELLKVCSPQKIEGFLDYVIGKIKKQGHKMKKQYDIKNPTPEVRQELEEMGVTIT